MGKKLFIIIFIVIIIIVLSVEFKQSNVINESGIKIEASFYILGYFAEQIVRDDARVHVVTPPGVEAHDFEPSSKDISNIINGDIFIFNGNGFDPWAEKIAQSLKNRDVFVVNISDEIKEELNLIKNTNPHYWLDPILAIREIEIIRDMIIKVNPKNAEKYTENSNILIEKLKKLHSDYERGISNCMLDTIIVSHSAFDYLGMRYNIKIQNISGVSPDEEPSPRVLGDIIKIANDIGIKHVFYETISSSKLAETIAGEIGAETLLLNPIETINQNDFKTGEDYESIMQKNLNNLRKALICN